MPAKARQPLPRDEIAALSSRTRCGSWPASPSARRPAPTSASAIAELAARLVEAARANRHEHGGVDAFMHQYALSSEEGIILMCLAEALLRIPDADTADQLIAEKIGGGRWEKHLGASDSLFVNASTFGLMLTGRVVRLGEEQGLGAGRHPEAADRPLRRAADPPGAAPGHAHPRRQLRAGADHRGGAEPGRADYEAQGYRFSFDMLGERAKTAADAAALFRPLHGGDRGDRRSARGRRRRTSDALMARPSVSVKLSAIHPRFDPGKEARLDAELLPRLVELAAAARRHGLGLTIDAEEQDRLDLTLGLFAAAFRDPALEGWPGLGLAVQAYGKRAMPVLRWLNAPRRARGPSASPCGSSRAPTGTARSSGRRSAGSPTIRCSRARRTRTCPTSPACASCWPTRRRSFRSSPPTTRSRSPPSTWRRATRAFEFQRLHGMGEALYEEVVGEGKLGRALPHLRAGRPARGPRRLPGAPPARERRQHLLRQPPGRRGGAGRGHRPRSRRDGGAGAGSAGAGCCRGRPTSICPSGATAPGWRSREPAVRAPLLEAIAAELDASFFAAARSSIGKTLGGSDAAELVLSPHDRRRARRHRAHGRCRRRSRRRWPARRPPPRPGTVLGGPARAEILERAADLYERDRVRLMAVMVREAGKTLDNALGDVREAVDFLRYYAAEARRLFAAPDRAPGPDRRDQHAGAARARPVRLHLALELPAGDLHGPGRGGAGGRQPRARQARRADADRRLARRRAAARGGRAAATCCICCPAPARSARPSSRTRAWPASSSPAPTRRAGPSTRRWRRGAARSCPSSRRPAA